jgi:imidazole glycerol-phosphate synthase subunit HisH
MIVVIDYGMGNPGSIQNMIRKVGGDCVISNQPEEVAAADALILPGVGSFDHGVEKLTQGGYTDALNTAVISRGVPFLGICLGMQLLFRSSEEGARAGLGWIDGDVRRFNFTENETTHKVPHMGWNDVTSTGNQFLGNANEELRFYFVHSFHGCCDDPTQVMAYSHYGYDFVSAVARENILGVQFHPEKSHRFGMHLFRNFLEIAEC